uniref:probable splicing factor, arginine/serine-rich 5 n=1 Tax=Lonchura striata TaxID=40157 RepID=UPI000B4CA462|nr:probable splicing factor, arginine/serine-rich 5 [Lonchura striata domestica]
MPAPTHRRRTESAPGRPKASRQNGRGLRGRRQARARPHRRSAEGTPALAPQRGRRWSQRSLNRGATASPRRPLQAERGQQLPPVPPSRRGSDTVPAPPISEGDRRRGLPQKRMGTEVTAGLAKVG